MLYNRLGVVPLDDFVNEVHKRTGDTLTLSKIEMLRGSGLLLVGLMYEGYFSVLPKSIPIKDEKTNRLYGNWHLHESKENSSYRYEEDRSINLIGCDEVHQFCAEDIVILLSHFKRFLEWLNCR